MPGAATTCGVNPGAVATVAAGACQGLHTVQAPSAAGGVPHMAQFTMDLSLTVTYAVLPGTRARCAMPPPEGESHGAGTASLA